MKCFVAAFCEANQMKEMVHDIASVVQGHVACPICAGRERPLDAGQTDSTESSRIVDEAHDLTWLDDL